jgi:uncharacterized membrane protein YfcA
MAGMDVMYLLGAYAALGLFAGLLAGLLGVGGGLVIVPVLAGLFAMQGFADTVIMPLALGTSLATIAFTSLSSLRAHHRRGAVRWPLMVQLSVGIAAGGWLGGFVARWLGGPLLALLVGVFELLVAAHLLFGKAPLAHRSEPGRSHNLVAGSIIGLVSALLGIGGGTLTVPWLVWHGVAMREAVGTAAACGLPIAVVGAFGFVLAGAAVSGLPQGSSGFVYWPAVAAISITSVLAAPLGARMAHSMPQHRLKQAFALMIGVLGVWMGSGG